MALLYTLARCCKSSLETVPYTRCVKVPKLAILPTCTKLAVRTHLSPCTKLGIQPIPKVPLDAAVLAVPEVALGLVLYPDTLGRGEPRLRHGPVEKCTNLTSLKAATGSHSSASSPLPR